jgi:hypothetical protein
LTEKIHDIPVMVLLLGYLRSPIMPSRNNTKLYDSEPDMNTLSGLRGDDFAHGSRDE